jgi:hypothetical protein
MSVDSIEKPRSTRVTSTKQKLSSFKTGDRENLFSQCKLDLSELEGCIVCLFKIKGFIAAEGKSCNASRPLLDAAFIE